MPFDLAKHVFQPGDGEVLVMPAPAVDPETLAKIGAKQDIWIGTDEPS